MGRELSEACLLCIGIACLQARELPQFDRERYVVIRGQRRGLVDLLTRGGSTELIKKLLCLRAFPKERKSRTEGRIVTQALRESLPHLIACGREPIEQSKRGWTIADL